MKDVRKLEIWQEAHQSAVDIYYETKSFPKEEVYGFTSQLRRSRLNVFIQKLKTNS